MAYEKQTWKNGDVVTSEKLNHIEGGIEAGCSPIIHTTTTDYQVFTFDKTFAEIKTMIDAGNMPLLEIAYPDGTGRMYLLLQGYGAEGTSWMILVLGGTSKFALAETEESYPVYDSTIETSGGGQS